MNTIWEFLSNLFSMSLWEVIKAIHGFFMAWLALYWQIICWVFEKVFSVITPIWMWGWNGPWWATILVCGAIILLIGFIIIGIEKFFESREWNHFLQRNKWILHIFGILLIPIIIYIVLPLLLVGWMQSSSDADYRKRTGKDPKDRPNEFWGKIGSSGFWGAFFGSATGTIAGNQVNKMINKK